MKIACIQTDQNIAKEKDHCKDLEAKINFALETNLNWNPKQQDQYKKKNGPYPNKFLYYYKDGTQELFSLHIY